MQIGRIARVLAIAVLVAACSDAQPSKAPGASSSAVPGPTAAAPRSTDAAAPESSPSSRDLIQAALNAGRIDPQAAMRDRIYAVFGAPGLPEEFRSSTWTEDNAILNLAASRLDKLPSDLADAIRPYLVRPTDPTSVFFGGEATAAARLASVRTSSLTAAVTCGANGWASVSGVSNFKVWGRCGAGYDNADLELVAGVLDTLWTDESIYMGRQPREDAGGPDEGGDDRVDFYLVSNCVTRDGACQTHTGLAVTRNAPPYVGSAGAELSSGYVVINRASIADRHTPATVAHELFHLLQNAFNSDGAYTGGESHWFYEASATWAEYRFVGDPTNAPANFAEYQTTNQALQDTDEDNEYRSFVWPLFMEEEAGDGTVAKAWAAVEGVATFDGFTDAIDAQLPFKQHFRDFAVRDWNDDDLAGVIGPMLPLGAVGNPRGEPALGRTGKSAILVPNAPGTAPMAFNMAIESLAPWFEDLQVDNGVGQVTLDFGGLQPRAARDVDLLVYVAGIGWERRQVIDDKIQLCRNVPEDKVTEIIVVVSNHDKDPAATVRGGWTAESLKDPCPQESVAEITSKSVYMLHIPQYGEHNVRIANLPDKVTTIVMSIHLVIVYEGGQPIAGLGSSFVIDKTVTGTNPEPPVHCAGSVGLWYSQPPSALADPNPIGQARIQGDPSALSNVELMLDFQTNNQLAPNECLGLGGMYPFTRVDDHTWRHDHQYSEIDPDRMYHSSTGESHGTISVP